MHAASEKVGDDFDREAEDGGLELHNTHLAGERVLVERHATRSS